MKNIISEVNEFLNKINKEYEIKFAYLFGSQSRGDATENSDIDIAVYFKKDYENLEEALIRGNIIEYGKEFFKKDVDVVSLNNASLLLKYQVIKDGIVILDDEERGEFESLSLRMYFDFKYYSDIYDDAMIKSIKNGEYFGG